MHVLLYTYGNAAVKNMQVIRKAVRWFVWRMLGSEDEKHEGPSG